MTRAIYVSLKETYQELNVHGCERDAHGIHNATTCWWKIVPTDVQGAKFLFGVFKDRVVSAYEIVVDDVNDWPIMKDHRVPKMKRRRAIPAVPLTDSQWATARTWRFHFIKRPVGYGAIDLTSGVLKQIDQQG